MRSLINEVANEGVFDRELSENDIKIDTLPGFKDFDPGTPIVWRRRHLGTPSPGSIC